MSEREFWEQEFPIAALKKELKKARTAQRKAEALLHQEQETIRALEAVAVKHGYDKEVGECLTEWFDDRLQIARELSAGGHVYSKQAHEDVQRSLGELRETKKILAAAIEQRDQKIDQLQEAVDHWKKKYQEKIFAND